MRRWQPVPVGRPVEFDYLFTVIYGKDRREVISRKECMKCNIKELLPKDFNDEQSLAEYHISGLCQACQDEVFAEY